MSKIILKDLVKKFGDNLVIPQVNLEIIDKEFLILVGPSGCGKSTLLNLIAGLEYSSDGKIFFDNLDVTLVNPKNRNIAMVFQSYALYPHMDIYDNMAFGLKLSNMKKEEIDQRVQNAANLLQIKELLKRKPKQLSGGQRQRVALGRALVREPSVFLLDEPLSNLDAKLRVEMRAQIIRLHKRVQTTMVYVTHDQVEAMSMADRIVILNLGNIMQVGSPFEVYHYPNNVFVAGFIGSPQMNLFPSQVNNLDGKYVLGLFGENLVLTEERAEGVAKYLKSNKSKKVTVGIRPEHIYAGHNNDETILPDATSDSSVGPVKDSNSIVVEGEIFVVEHLGSATLITVEFNGQRIAINQDGYFDTKIGDKIKIRFYDPWVYLFDPDSEETILTYKK